MIVPLDPENPSSSANAEPETGGGTIAYFIDHEPKLGDFRDAVVAGLSGEPKTIPPKFFYDEWGSALFHQICETEEYYLTRTEVELLRDKGPEIAALAGENTTVVEYGCGSSLKIRTLLDSLIEPAEYVAIDISREHLCRVAEDIATDYADIRVGAICADFTKDLELPAEAGINGGRKIGFFPGSTIGNQTPEEASHFLARVRRQVDDDGALVIGVDLKKDPALLDAAYNDGDGVTAQFNLNVLGRMNRELDAVIDLDAFEHLAFYNAPEGRVEMHLKSRKAQSAVIAGREFSFAEGETIHTENSYKYHIGEFTEMAGEAGFSSTAAWTDENALFSIHYLTAG